MITTITTERDPHIIRNIELLRSFGFEVSERHVFKAAPNLPEGLLERSAEYAGSWVIWDPQAGEGGFMIIGYDLRALTDEAVEVLELQEILSGEIHVA